MPQSLAKVYVHVVFSTKNRQPLLDELIRPSVHGYLATTIRNLASPWVVVGGVADHIHILFDVGKQHAPVTFIERAKRESSKFVKKRGTRFSTFHWQRGYGMFSVGPEYRALVERYVRNQEEHHRTTTFEEEFRALLHQSGIAFDERYVWD